MGQQNMDESVGSNNHYSWIPFYMEMADKLLTFKDNRKALSDIVYAFGEKYTDYIHTDTGEQVPDIDPFTVFGVFNRGITEKNRFKFCKYFKDALGIKADVPSEFDGIPVVFNQKSTFYFRKHVATDIQPLWNLFEAVLTRNEEHFAEYFDIVCKQHGIKWNITMGLYWIRPYDYISLDSLNRDYLESLGLDVFDENGLDSLHYIPLLNKVKDKIVSGEITERSIPEISYRAYQTWSVNNKRMNKNNQQINDNKHTQMKYQKYIDLLKETHNLVLTGAPGTGKTYMAQAIAQEMGAITKFVQFHPSYDYTDFVEGLRPLEKNDGQMGFELKDGVFKEFCREAIKNLADSEKSEENLTKELSWQEKLDRFIDESIESGEEFETVNGSKFVISEMRNHTIVVHNEQNEKNTQVAVNADEILELLTNEVPLKIVKDIRNYFSRKFGTQPDSYAFAIIQAVRKMKQEVPTVEVSKIEKKPFVFIIDEINRGEASKIFGELFYAIDPGYRGKKDYLVQTQYQNLVPETDVFAKGFYVPENVYILATMNDIDRSVESMDFAMRRRFTWIEVTPADTESMLDSLPYPDNAKATMNRLNKVIANTDGLGPAYMIGPSYFLKLGDNGYDYNKLWTMNIEPLLKEYLRGFRNSKPILEKFNRAFFDKMTDED